MTEVSYPEIRRDEGKIWLDRLCEKHECFPHGDVVMKQIQVNSQTVSLAIPHSLARVAPLRTALADDVLFILGTDQEQSYDGLPLGVVIVARRSGPETFTTRVWHELYPWAIKYLAEEELAFAPPQESGAGE